MPAIYSPLFSNTTCSSPSFSIPSSSSSSALSLAVFASVSVYQMLHCDGLSTSGNNDAPSATLTYVEDLAPAHPLGPPAHPARVERSQLVLAQRRRDFREVAEIDAQLATLDSVTGSQVRSEKEDILAKVNERNRAANREAVRRAEVAEAERKRKMWKEKRAAVVSAAASGESRPNTPGPK